ncbi:MAG: hypothetical protein JW809_04020 [Pirellulales bacterium]|nr:hypothetical protein [Pirellulales bacterium]
MCRTAAVALSLLLVSLAPAGFVLADDAPTGPLDRAGREQWVRAALDQMDRANAVVLEPDAVAQQHARFERMLAPLVEGDPGWGKAVAEFEAELHLSQRAAIEHLTRQLRIQVYETFRRDRPEFDRRRDAMQSLTTAWTDAGSPAWEQHKLVDWLQTALVRSRRADGGALPPIPSFAAGPPVAVQIVQVEPPPPAATLAPAPPPAPTPAPTLESAPAPSVALPLPTLVEPPAPSDPVFRSPAAGQTPDRPTPIPAPRVTSPAPLTPPAPSARTEAAPAPAGQTTLSGPIGRTSHKPVAAPAAPTLPGVPSGSPSVLVLPVPPATAAEHKSQPVPVVRAPQPPAPPAAAAEPIDPKTPSPRTPRPEPPGGAAAPVRSNEPRPAPALAAPADVPEPDRPVDVSPNPAAPAPSSPRDRAKVNLRELAAQIAGNNLALEKLVVELEQRATWSPEGLESILDRATPLLSRKDDLKMFYDLLGADQREQVGQLNSGSEVISAIGARIARARVRAQQPDYPGGDAARQAQLRKLDALSKKLSKIVFGDL